jgi:hypothetical protein
MAKDFQLQSAPPQIVSARAILTVLSLNNVGTTGAVANQGAAKFDIEQDASSYNEGLLKLEVKTTNGQGGTPTTPGSGKKITLHYAFCSDDLTASDAPTVLANVDATLDCTLPDSNSAAAAGTAYHATDPFVQAGRYLYVWYDRDAFGSANALVDLIAKLVRL